MTKIKFKNSPVSVKVIYIAFFVIFTFFAFLYLFPLIWAILNSFKTIDEYASDSLALPGKWLWWHYRAVFTEFQAVPLSGGEPFRYFDMLFNSLWILVVNVFVNVVSSALLAYALARFRFPGSKFLYAVVIFANTIPIIGAGPAQFKLAKAMNLINNPALICGQAVSILRLLCFTVILKASAAPIPNLRKWTEQITGRFFLR